MNHPINRLVLDLSHHNTVHDFGKMAASGIAGIIHKASEGNYMTDSKYEGRRSGCEEYGICWGAYHFATSNDPQEQALTFIEKAQPDEDTLLCLDWEPYGDKTMSKGQAKAWIQEVEGRLKRPGEVVIYSGNLAKEQLTSSDTFFGERRLWLAQYSSAPVVKPPWSKFWLWQYSDGQAGPQPHEVPGVQSPVDCNSYDGTATELVSEWATGTPVIKPTQETVTITVEAPPGIKVVIKGI